MLQGTVGGAVESKTRLALARTPRALRIALRSVPVFACFALLFTWPARLYDSDAYLHLSLARTVAAHGFLDHLEWARFSTLGRAFGDKELLFHLLLVPFVKFGYAELGGQIALALLCTAIAISLWELGGQALGRRGVLVPLLVFGSGSFMLRAIRLRPELLAMLLLVWIVWTLAQRKYWVAAALSFAFAFSHTAFHSLLGLAVLCVAWQLWSERRWEWQLVAATWSGVVLAVLLHPQLPRNLSVFWVQNVVLFGLKGQLDHGPELSPYPLDELAQLDALFWLGLLALAASTARIGMSTARDARASDPTRRMAAFCWIATACFTVLFASMSRFATLVIPFAALAVSFELAARSSATPAIADERLRLFGGRSWPAVPILSVFAALSVAHGLTIAFVNFRLGGSFDRGLRHELDELAQWLVPGCTVAANWNDAELYAFYAPHARYMNVYDPVFMAVADPGRYALWMDVLAGGVPDTAAAIHDQLESEFVAFQAGPHPELERRLAGDPRVTLVHQGRHLLYRVRQTDPRFMSDWTLEPRATNIHSTTGYVDATSMPEACTTFAATQSVAEPRTELIELAGWGPTELFVDGQQRLQLPAARLARLGEGAAIPVRLESGEHRWRVRTCKHAGRAGFYLVNRTAH